MTDDDSSNNNTGTTRLTPEQQKAVLYWPRNIKAGIIKIDSTAKDAEGKPKPLYNLEDWRDVDLSAIDYETRVKNGYYDSGIAVRLGKTLDERHYLVGIDIDGWDAVVAWFGSWENVMSFAKTHRVEWHNDKARLHIILKLKESLTNKVIHTSDTSQIEIRCEGMLLRVSPSVHGGDGNEFKPLGTEDIAVYDEMDRLGLIGRINTLCRGYMSDNDRHVYRNWLEEPGRIIQKGKRHDVVRFLACSYYYRFNNSWKDFTDDQRHDKLVEWNLQHCIPPLPDMEFEDIWKWVKITHRKERDELHKKLNDEREKAKANANQNNENPNEYGPDVAGELHGNIFYKINQNPPKFIIAYNQTKKLIEAKIQSKEIERLVNGKSEVVNAKYLVHTRTYLTCIPTKIIRHKNPLTFLNSATKYTMSFGDAANEYVTFKHKTLIEILAGLRDRGYVLAADGAEGALGTMIQAYKERKIIEDNDDIEYTGFFLSEDGKTIIASNITIKESVSKAELADSLKFIDELADKGYRASSTIAGENDRLDLLATSIIWGITAPIDLILKSNERYLKWLHYWGITNATKSTTGKIILAIDRHHTDEKFLLNAARIETIARLGEAISKTTFPKLVDEVDLIDKLKNLVNDIKSAIVSKILRDKFLKDGTTLISILALSPLILTSNPPPPFYDSAYMRRIIERGFPQSESHKLDDPASIQFEEFIKLNLDRLGALGDFRNWFVMNNPDIILDKKLKPLELGKKILTAAYKHAEMKIPDWFDKLLPENQLEESLADNAVIVKRAFEAYITSSFDRAYTIWRIENPEDKDIKLPYETTSRFGTLLKFNRLPDIKQHRDKIHIIISKGLLTELYKLGVTKDQLPSLKVFAECINADYYKSTTGNYVVKTTMSNLEKYFDEVKETN